MEREHVLIQKLDRFIRRYYINRMIRGSVLTTGILAGTYLLMVILENLFHFDSVFRTILFYLFPGIGMAAVTWWIIRPLLSYLNLGQRISYEKAAEIVGEHFAEINDKLLNALQLIRQSKERAGDMTLLLASIDQRINTLKVFPFNRIIRYHRNFRYLKVALPPVTAILLLLLISPGFISEPTHRIVDHSTAFGPAYPFVISIVNTSLTAFQQEDFELNVAVSGTEIPSDLYLHTDGYSYRMKKNSDTRFSYLFTAIQKDTRFRISANKYMSSEYLIHVYPRPTILSFTVHLSYPDYTGKKDEETENTGDIMVPRGTEITWRWVTKDVDTLNLRMAGKEMKLEKGESNLFTYHTTCMASGSYSIRPQNAFSMPADSLFYRIVCIEDGYPSIVTELDTDTSGTRKHFITGSIKDDYGFSRLEFHYSITAGSDLVVRDSGTTELKVPLDSGEEAFYFMIEEREYVKNPGDRMSYYFEVWDNDAINGPKPAKSEIREIKTPTIDELIAGTSQSEKQIRDEIRKSKEEAGEVERAIDQLTRKMVEKQELNWQEKQKIDDLIRKNEEMLNSIEQVKEENRKNIQREEEYLQTSQAILEKQKRLNELMEELMTEEMRKMLEELRELMDQVDKTKLKSLMEEMKMTAREMEQQLDRNLELFRQVEFERKLEETIDALRKLAEKQEKLASEVKKELSVSEKQEEAQKGLNNRFDSIQQELGKLSEMEKELESPMGLEKTRPRQEEISRSMSEAREKLRNNEGKEAAESQKKAGDQMKQLANEMEAMQMEMEIEQYAEDARQIRQLLENLLTVSFDQEELISRTRTINRNDPGYQEIITEQNRMNENLQPVRDSLVAIGRRQFLIQPVITRELNSIQRNIRETVESLTDRNISTALSKQQFSMTSLNNLAVLLDEAREQMNRNMNSCSQGKSSKMCQNPSMGKGKKSMKNIREMQQQMSEKMERIRKGLEDQKTQGQKQSEKGSKGNREEKGMSEEIARLAAEQEAIREELQRYEQSLKEQGEKDPGGLQNAIREMEQNERDLINKAVTRESLLRQQQILTRLLESEKAEQVREQQEKRESDEAKNQKYSNPQQKNEYNKYSVGGVDVLRYKTLPVNHYYKNKANRYLIQITK